MVVPEADRDYVTADGIWNVEGNTIEWCPLCETEVELPGDKLAIYACPNCGYKIINCSVCYFRDCAHCKINQEESS